MYVIYLYVLYIYIFTESPEIFQTQGEPSMCVQGCHIVIFPLFLNSLDMYLKLTMKVSGNTLYFLDLKLFHTKMQTKKYIKSENSHLY